MSDYVDSLLDFHPGEPIDIPGSDKVDSVILEDVLEEEPNNLSVSQSNSDLLNESMCVRVVNMLQGDNVLLRSMKTACHQKEESEGGTY